MAANPDNTPDPVDVEQPFLSHLVELRDRLLRSVITVTVIFLVLVPFANDLTTFITDPLRQHLENQPGSLQSIKPLSPILTPLKVTLMVAIYIAIPLLLYQAWAFIAPGLYRQERKLVLPLIISSSVLYYLGMLFAYIAVMPLVFLFLSNAGPDWLVVAPDLAEYLDFVLTLFLAFGIAFEVPIATVVLIRTGAVEIDTLRQKRPYVIVGAFCIGMFLTPPDIISQTLLALPMWVLYEIGLLFGALTRKKATETNPDQSADEPMSDAAMEAEFDRAEADISALDEHRDAQP